MPFRVILARLTGSSLDEAVMDGALALASTTAEGHIHALMVRPDLRLALPSPNEAGMSPEFYDAIFDSMQRTALLKASLVRAKVEEWCSARGVKLQAHATSPMSADFCDFIGAEGMVLAHAARLADVTVMALENATLDDEAVAAVLLESGRPVMLVPANASRHTSLSNILVAWNDSPEAARAVSAAIPLMRKAEKVTVITAEDGPLEKSAADRLASYLVEEGVRASAMHSESASNMSVVARLLTAVKDTHAQLLVMGAYSHSRAREMIFGGVTRYLLRHSPIITFICH